MSPEREGASSLRPLSPLSWRTRTQTPAGFWSFFMNEVPEAGRGGLVTPVVGPWGSALRSLRAIRPAGLYFKGECAFSAILVRLLPAPPLPPRPLINVRMHSYLFSSSVCHLVGGEGKRGEGEEGKGRLCRPSSYFSVPMPPKRRQVGSLCPERGALR